MRRLSLLVGLVLMATTLSRDTFTGGDAASLDGGTPDGGGVPAQTTGTYARDNNLGTPGTDEIAIQGGVAVAYGPAGARYGLGSIPSLPANYRTIAEFLFPDRASGTSCAGLTPGTGEDPGAADFSTGQWGIRLTGHFAAPFDFPDARAITAWLYTDPGVPEGYSIKLERDRDLIGFPDEVHCYVITDAFGNGNAVEVGDVGVDTDFTIELHVFTFGTKTLLCSYLNGTLVDSRLITGLPQPPIDSAGSEGDVVTNVEVFQLTGFPGGLGTLAYATQEVMVKWDKDTATGYLLRTEMFEDSDLPTVDYYLEEWSAGVATGLRYTAQLPITYGTPQIASLEYLSGVLYARDTAGALIWDNGSGQSFDIAVDVADDTAATVASHTTGDPGFGASDGTGFFLTITEHRVERDGGTGPCMDGTGTPGSEELLARDDWTGGDDADIDARALDGGTGTWERHPEYPDGNLDIESGAAVCRDSDFSLYTVDGLPAETLPRAVESVSIYPQLDVPTGSVTGPFCHQDAELTGVSSETNPDTGNLFHNGPDVTFVDSWTVWFLRPPNSTSITAETTVSADSYTDGVGVFVPAEDIFVKLFYEKDGSGVSRVYITITHESSNPYKAILDRDHALLATQDTGFTEHDYCNYLHFSWWIDDLGSRFIAKWNNGSAGGASQINAMAAPSYSASGVTLYGNQADQPTGGEAYEFAPLWLVLNCDAVVDTGYQAQVEFDHNLTFPQFIVSLHYAEAGSYRRLISNFSADFGILAEHDRSYRWRFWRDDADVLRLAMDGTEMLTFDLVNDTPETVVGPTVLLLAGGRPALGSNSTDPAQMLITQFSVYDLTAEIPCVPCVPGGGGGGGGGGGEGLTQAFMWTRRNLDWHDLPTPSETTDQVIVRANLADRIARRGWVRANLAWRELDTETTFVLDPTDNPDTPGMPCEGVVDPFPPPTPVGTKAFGLYNMTKNLLDQYPPFNGAITGSSVGALPSLLAAIAARSFQLWFVPAFRNEQTEDNSGRGRYDHTATMAKFATFSGFSDANQGVIPFCIPYDEPLCSLCWEGKPPTETEVKAGCAAITSYLGVSCAIRLSPVKMLAAGWTPGAGNIRIGMAQYGGATGYDNNGFGSNYAGYIAAQISAATTLGLDGILWGLNPFRTLAGGWLPEWTDAFLETVGLQAAAAGMNYGVYMWLGYPPSTKVLIPSTNAALQTIAAAL